MIFFTYQKINQCNFPSLFIYLIYFVARVLVVACGFLSYDMRTLSCSMHVGSSSPTRSNPGPLHWERGVLTTAPPGKSLPSLSTKEEKKNHVFFFSIKKKHLKKTLCTLGTSLSWLHAIYQIPAANIPNGKFRHCLCNWRWVKFAQGQYLQKHRSLPYTTPRTPFM